jgi:hypothetical protein
MTNVKPVPTFPHPALTGIPRRTIFVGSRAEELSMVEASYILYLLMLLLLPLLMQWRWGLAAAVIVTIADLALVGLVPYLLASYHLLPTPNLGEAPPLTGPEERSRWDQTVSGVLIFLWLHIPGVAALAGGGLSVVSAALLAIWRSIAARRRTVEHMPDGSGTGRH